MDINNANNNDTIDLRKLFSLMMEKKKIVIAIIVICTIIATIVAFVLPKSYQSTTLVRVKSDNISSMAGYAAMAAGFGIDISANSSASPAGRKALSASCSSCCPLSSAQTCP